MFVLGKVLSTTAVLLCILCLAAPLKKTKAGQKIKGLRILLKPHVLYGWLLLVIGLMHGIMAGKNPGMINVCKQMNYSKFKSEQYEGFQQQLKELIAERSVK